MAILNSLKSLFSDIWSLLVAISPARQHLMGTIQSVSPIITVLKGLCYWEIANNPSRIRQSSDHQVQIGFYNIATRMGITSTMRLATSPAIGHFLNVSWGAVKF
jgi:hypothetical protein